MSQCDSPKEIIRAGMTYFGCLNDSEEITTNSAKEILRKLFDSNKSIEAIMNEEDYLIEIAIGFLLSGPSVVPSSLVTFLLLIFIVIGL